MGVVPTQQPVRAFLKKISFIFVMLSHDYVTNCVRKSAIMYKRILGRSDSPISWFLTLDRECIIMG